MLIIDDFCTSAENQNLQLSIAMILTRFTPEYTGPNEVRVNDDLPPLRAVAAPTRRDGV